jgi:hypothetical protein
MTVAADTKSRSRPRAFTRGRIVALVLVAAAVAGLAYLRFAPDADPVSVPAGAKAGDVILEQCEYATEDGSYAADCGTLVVPEHRADPQSRLIALPVTRIRARSGNGAEPIFRLQGGPGITNMKFREASRFADDRDVVLVGYRGMDGSSVLDCPEVESALKRARLISSARSRSASGPTPFGRARSDSRTTGSISPATASRSESTIWRPRARRSATAASTC